MENANVTPTSGRSLRSAKAFFFTAAGLSFVLSIALWFSGDREQGLFVGLWVPSILSAANLVLHKEGGDD